MEKNITASLLGVISITLCLTGLAIENIWLMLIAEAVAVVAIGVAVTKWK